ncbi:MAG: polysaccharide deacetylase family protein [Chthoniobacteraceae bacterium]|jgi:peptidoglycan/xylan/chitin deacetylase (PgdA/CDA1 family)
MIRPALFLIVLLSLIQARAQTPEASASAMPMVSGTPTPASDLATQPATPAVTGTVPVRITYSHVNVDGPYIAMTFDDGPSGPNTPRLLDLAAKKHIKLTFFLIGQNAARYPDLVRRELAEGHEVGNHSWTHPVLSKMSNDAVRAELQKTQDAIVAATGYRPTLMRPPYGALTPKQRLWVSQEFGFKIILWEVDPLDWKRPGPSVVAARIIAAVRPGSIILSHDIHSQTVDAMPEVFDTLLAKGYKFVTVSELIAMDKGPVKKKTAAAASSTPGTNLATAPAQ